MLRHGNAEVVGSYETFSPEEGDPFPLRYTFVRWLTPRATSCVVSG